MLKKVLFFILVLVLAAPCNMALAARNSQRAQTPPVESREAVQSKLDKAAEMHLARANNTLRPNRKHVQITRQGNQYRAWFMEGDRATLKTELHDSPKGKVCKYVGHVIYIENTYECLGKTREEALSGQFKQVRSRRMRELTLYDRKGRWIF